MADKTYTFVSGTELHEERPDRFFVPSPEVKEKIEPGDAVRLIFNHEEPDIPQETMWVYVRDVDYPHFKGQLMEWSLFKEELTSRVEVEFEADHIIFVKKKRDM